MKLSELICSAQRAMAEYGDLDVRIESIAIFAAGNSSLPTEHLNVSPDYAYIWIPEEIE